MLECTKRDQSGDSGGDDNRSVYDLDWRDCLLSAMVLVEQEKHQASRGCNETEEGRLCNTSCNNKSSRTGLLPRSASSSYCSSHSILKDSTVGQPQNLEFDHLHGNDSITCDALEISQS